VPLGVWPRGDDGGGVMVKAGPTNARMMRRNRNGVIVVINPKGKSYTKSGTSKGGRGKKSEERVGEEEY
jgi:hypothetical protein